MRRFLLWDDLRIMDQAVFLLIVGFALTAATLVKALLERFCLPPLVGYICLGILLKTVGDYGGLLGSDADWTLEFLADIGLVSLLFRAGLESDLRGLLRQLPRAVPIWFGNVVASSILGFLAVRYVLHGDLLVALFIGTALSATSVGVSVAVWRDVGALRSSAGELLLDVAELDDLSAIFFMSLLLALASERLLFPGGSIDAVALSLVAGWLFLKASALCAFCLVFAYRTEKRVTAFFLSHERPPAPALAIFGIAIAIAGAAAALGFSVAVGAFFAGLVFSRDPAALKSESSIEPLYEAFIPFFFLGLGFQMAPTHLAAALWPALLLLAAAVVGKLVGVAVPGLPLLGRPATELLAVSMVPRAEIAMAVVLSGFKLGAVPAHLYCAMVLVSAATCLITPLVLRPLLGQANANLDG
jgi:Kef-type K+ transport system membrane component KefB